MLFETPKVYFHQHGLNIHDYVMQCCEGLHLVPVTCATLRCSDGIIQAHKAWLASELGFVADIYPVRGFDIICHHLGLFSMQMVGLRLALSSNGCLLHVTQPFHEPSRWKMVSGMFYVHVHT